MKTAIAGVLTSLIVTGAATISGAGTLSGDRSHASMQIVDAHRQASIAGARQAARPLKASSKVNATKASRLAGRYGPTVTAFDLHTGK